MDGITFTIISIIKFNALQAQYQLNHFPVKASINYSRLKLINRDSSSTYSNTLVVRKNLKQNNIIVYPQPSDQYVNVSISVLSTQSTIFRLLNPNGQQVQIINTKLTKGDNYFQIKNLKTLPNGVYFLNAIIDNEIISKKLFIGR